LLKVVCCYIFYGWPQVRASTFGFRFVKLKGFENELSASNFTSPQAKQMVAADNDTRIEAFAGRRRNNNTAAGQCTAP